MSFVVLKMALTIMIFFLLRHTKASRERTLQPCGRQFEIRLRLAAEELAFFSGPTLKYYPFLIFPECFSFII